METLQLIAVGLTVALGTLTIIGLAVRMILVPYLRTHLIEPLGVVRNEVKNSHAINLRDDLDEKHAQTNKRLDELNGRLDDLELGHTRTIIRVQSDLLKLDARLDGLEHA